MMKEVLTEPDLSPSQRAAWDAIKGGRHICVTGVAGSGKSSLLEFIKKQTPGASVSAATGVAAVRVHAVTLHTWAAMFPEHQSPHRSAAIIRRNTNRLQEILDTDILIIDEVSMVSVKMLEDLNEVLQVVRDNGGLFGGVQIVAFGDFLQLRPVKAEFCFTSDLWDRAAFHLHYLEGSFRQQNSEFADFLNNIRVGRFTPQTGKILDRMAENEVPASAVTLVATNPQANRINKQAFERLKTPIFEYQADYKKYSADDYDRNGSDQEYEDARKTLSKDVLAPDKLRLRVGSKVMLLKNIDFAQRLINGSQGFVRDLSPTAALVEFENGCREVFGQEEWYISASSGRKIASKFQLPFRLSDAITIHKSQGLQFSDMSIDISQCFTGGQAYVGLSRALTPQGLQVTKWSRKKLLTDPQAMEFYAKHAVS